MTSTGELERLVQPSDLRGRHGRRRPGRRRGWFSAVSDAVAAALSAVLH